LNNLEFCEEYTISYGCDECKKKYCENCFNTLHLPKKLQSHKPVTLSKMETLFCTNHLKDFAGYYCFIDKCFICSECAISEHNKHNPVKIKEAFDILHSELKQLNFSNDLININKSIQRIDETKRERLANYEYEKFKLEKMIEKLKMNVEKDINELNQSKESLELSFTILREFGENLNSEKSFVGLLKLKQELMLNSFAQNRLAVCYENGDGVEKDFKRAVELYTMAANLGNSDAQNSLAYRYQHGKGIEKDSKKAIELYELSAKQGNLGAISSLAYCYQFGDGVEKDLKKALELYQLSENK
jgi:hypothetical protein